MKQDIRNLNDIKLLVDSFYEKVRKDELLAEIFNQTIKNKWPQHLEKMYSFWQTVLFHKAAYQGSPFLPHQNLPINSLHFNRWLKLFTATLDEHFEGEKAYEAKSRAGKMSEMFQYKLTRFHNNPENHIQ